MGVFNERRVLPKITPVRYMSQWHMRTTAARFSDTSIPQHPGVHGSWPAIDALRQIGLPAVPALVEALNTSDINSEPIVRALYTIGPPVDAVPALVRAIKEVNPDSNQGVTR